MDPSGERAPKTLRLENSLRSRDKSLCGAREFLWNLKEKSFSPASGSVISRVLPTVFLGET